MRVGGIATARPAATSSAATAAARIAPAPRRAAAIASQPLAMNTSSPMPPRSASERVSDCSIGAAGIPTATVHPNAGTGAQAV